MDSETHRKYVRVYWGDLINALKIKRNDCTDYTSKRTINKAINSFSNCFRTPTPLGETIFVEIDDPKHLNGCDFCRSHEILTDAAFGEENARLFYNRGFLFTMENQPRAKAYSFKVSYCPKCGREL